jgi:mercuric ion transport protein
MPTPETTASTLPWPGYAWGVLAALTCPCHLPVLALLLSGTAVGALISDHMGLAVIVGVALFGTFIALAMRAFNARR